MTKKMQELIEKLKPVELEEAQEQNLDFMSSDYEI